MVVDDYTKLYLPGDTLELTDRSTYNPKGNPTKVGNPTLNKSRWVNNSGSVYQTDGTIISNTGVVQGLGRPISVIGDAKIKTDQFVFGNSSGYFSGNAYCCLSLDDSPDWYLGNDAFTIDCWVNFSELRSQSRIYQQYSSSTNAHSLRLYWSGTAYQLGWFTYNSSSSIYYTADWSDIAINTWYHIAVVRENSTTTKMYVNGVQIGTTLTTNYTVLDNSSILYIGGDNGSSTVNYLKGYIDEFRWSKGIARWTSNFTPSTYNYNTDIYTYLLIHFNGVNNSTVFSDNSAENSASFNTSGYFNNYYLTIPDSPNWCFGTDNFTVDFWVYFKELRSQSRFYQQYSSSSNAHSFRLYNDGTYYYLAWYTYSSPITYLRSRWDTVQVNTWYHIAVVRESLTATKIYVNGIQLGDTYTDNYVVGDSTSSLYIGGASGATSTDYLIGHIDEFRISKGIARWTSNFVPSITPYTTDSYTKLLLHFDNVNNSTIIVDDSKSMSVENYTSAVYLNGSNYLYMNNANDYNFGSDDFTIEFWYCPKVLPATGNAVGLITKRNTLSSRLCYTIEHYTNDKVQFYWSYNGTTYTLVQVATGLTVDKWRHISVNRKDDSCYTSIDGVITLYPNVFSGSIYYSNDQLNIGKLGVGDGSSTMTGYLTDIHISKGIARYTKDFIPPTTYRSVDQYSKLALRFDNYNGSTFFYDWYEPGYLPVFGSTYFFTGSSCNCYWGDSVDWYLGTGDFTIEFLFRRNAFDPVESQKILQQWNSTSLAWIFYFSINSICLTVWPGPYTWQVMWSNYDDNWHHIAFVRDAINSVKAYIDGVQIGITATGVYNIPDSSNNLYLGGVGAETSSFNGWLTNFSISKGIARYTSNFISPLATDTSYIVNSNYLIKRPRCIYSGEIEELHDGDSLDIGGELQLICDSYINIDFISYDTQSIILTKNVLINFSNISNGKHCRLIITQDDVGGRTISFINNIKWPQGILPILSVTGGVSDIFTFIKSRDIIYGDYLKIF